MEVPLEVLIPVFNGEATIGAAIRSVLRQTLPVARITVVDNCSTDRTAEIVRSFAGVRYVRNETNVGMSANWNRCLEIAESEFVSILHADDLLCPAWHESCRAQIQAHGPGGEFCLFLGTARFSGSDRITNVHSFPDAVDAGTGGTLLRALWRHCFYGLGASASMVYSRRLVERMGRFPAGEYPNMADVPLNWRLLTEQVVFHSPEVVVLNRQSAAQGSCRRRGELASGAVKCFTQFLPVIAERLGCSVDEVAAEYLFPYWVMVCLGRFGAGHLEMPDLERHVMNRAMKCVRPGCVARIMLRQLAEKRRRRMQVRRLEGALRRLLLGLEG